MTLPDGEHPRRRIRVPDPLSPIGSTEVTVVDIVSHGYRLRLVDHPPAFDRAGYYGDPVGGDYPDNAWRFGLFCRAALETLRADGRPIDVIHLHDWHAGPAVILRDRFYADDPIIGPAAALMTIHNLAYHGWVPLERLGELGLAPGDGVVAADAAGIDLLGAGIERSELANTVSPGYAAEALTPEYGMGLDDTLRVKARQTAGDGSPRFFGILNGIDTELWDPATDVDLAARYSADDLAGKAISRADLLTRHGMDPDDPAPVLGMIGRLDPQKGFDILADAGTDPRRSRCPDHRPGQWRPAPRRSVPRPRRRATGPGRPGRAVRPGQRPADLRRLGPVPDAVPVRAVRAGPDDRAPVRHAAGGPSDRRSRRHRRRRGRATGGGDRVRVRRAHARGAGGRLPAGLRRPRSGRLDDALGRRRRSRDGARLQLGVGFGAALRARLPPCGRPAPGGRPRAVRRGIRDRPAAG